MAVQLLRPHDCLKNSPTAQQPPLLPLPKSCSKPNPFTSQQAPLLPLPKYCSKPNPFTSQQAPLLPLPKYCPKPNPYTSQQPPLLPCQNISLNPTLCLTGLSIPCPSYCRKQQKPSRSNNNASFPARSTFQKVPAANNQLIGQLKFLKRGGVLIKPVALDPIKNLPSPKKVQELRLYAGSCTSNASPPPSSLPVPSFLAKNRKRVVMNTEKGQEPEESGSEHRGSMSALSCTEKKERTAIRNMRMYIH